LESQLKQQQPTDLKREIMTLDGESSPKVRELEKIIRLLKQEKEEAQKVNRVITEFYFFCGERLKMV
jgi:tellurite resistance protein